MSPTGHSVTTGTYSAKCVVVYAHKFISYAVVRLWSYALRRG